MLTQMLIEDLKRTEHLVYVDTAMNMTDLEEKGLRLGEKPIDQDKVMQRSTMIAERAHQFLKKLHVPPSEQFSDPSFPGHLRSKARYVNDKLQKELEKHPKRKIHAIEPEEAAKNPNLEPVVIAGVAFFLDHENQLVIPVEPSKLPEKKSALLSRAKTHLSPPNFSKSNSKTTSGAVSPRTGSNSPARLRNAVTFKARDKVIE